MRRQTDTCRRRKDVPITPASYAHREELTIHKAAKKAFHELGVKRIPKVKDLNAEYARLMAEKKQTFAEYRKARDEVKKYL